MTVDSPGDCRPAAVSAETGERVEAVTWGRASGDGYVTEEFTTDATVADETVDAVFDAGDRTRYRFDRADGDPCACEIIESVDCPLTDVAAEDDQLHLTFYAPDIETVRTAVTDLRERYDGVHLRHLCRSGDLDGEDLVLVDRSALTDRQAEVLATAYEEGYFEHPKEANASELAAQLDISLSTFTEHLSLAQSKVLAALVEDG